MPSTPTEPPLQRRLAEHVLTLDPLQEGAVRDRLTDCLVDWVGVAAASCDAPVVTCLEDAGGDSSTRTAGTGVPVASGNGCFDPLWAARVNGTSGHAQDFDDTHATSLVHVSSAVLPALFSALADVDVDGEDFLRAYGIGIWTCEVLSPGAGPALLHQGLHPTATLGAIAAAAASARLLGLDANRCQTALGLAASSAYGTLANFGTMAKPLQAGLAAANGLLAARLAQRGITAGAWVPRRSENAGPVVRTLLGEDVRDSVWAALVDDAAAGARIPSAVANVSHKPYAACLLTHAAITGAIEMAPTIAERGGRSAIRSVRVRATDETIAAAGDPAPTSGYAAKFSLAYCVATGLLRGAAPVRAFAEDFGRDREVNQLAEIVSVSVDASLRGFSVDLEVALADGTVLRCAPDSAPGQPGQPLTGAQIDDKFRENLARRFDDADIDEQLGSVRRWVAADSARASLERLWSARPPNPV